MSCLKSPARAAHLCLSPHGAAVWMRCYAHVQRMHHLGIPAVPVPQRLQQVNHRFSRQAATSC